MVAEDTKKGTQSTMKMNLATFYFYFGDCEVVMLENEEDETQVNRTHYLIHEEMVIHL